MRLGTVAFAAGTALLLGCRQLPDPAFVQLIPVCLVLAFFAPRLRAPALAVLGFLYALLHVALTLHASLPAGAVRQDVRVEGVVASIPSNDALRQRFVFAVDRIELPSGDVAQTSGVLRVRLDWYGRSPSLVPGERWRLTARLKPPHGFMNPDGFDYETWLFRERIRATGYVRARADNALLGRTRHYAVHRVRQRILFDLRQRLAGRDHAGLVPALSVGVRDELSQSEWRVFRDTGTSHLVAISGLHIGLVAGLIFWLVRQLWVLSATAALTFSATRVAALAAMLAAVAYAGLAGFSVPTQRALLMCAVVLAGLGWRRAVMPSVSMSWALLGVLLIDPLSLLSVGFWLSFGAVAALLFALGNRFGSAGHFLTNTLKSWGRVQWAATLGLLPLMLYVFSRQPLVAPLANLVAVPWMSLVVVPLTLLGVAISACGVALGSFVLDLALGAFHPLWHTLEWLGALAWTYQIHGRVSMWMIACALAGITLLLSPVGFPGRWVGCIWLLPALLPGGQGVPETGGFRLHVLDVGQGLAVVVQTHAHVLVYDAGPRFGSHYDAGRAVVVPFLHGLGLAAADAMVISHADTDHSGGAASVLQDVEVRMLYVGEPGGWAPAKRCEAGTGWRWDGVDFQFLHPAAESGVSGNDASCVLRVAGRGGAALLPGDIEQAVEAGLVRTHRNDLRADILVAPHHGSATSSSGIFLAAVQPSYVAFSVGYLNRFGFPHRGVVERAQAQNAELLDTPRHGAIVFDVAPRTGVAPPRAMREHMRRPWHNRP